MTTDSSIQNDPDELDIRVPVSLAERHAGQLAENTLRVAAAHFREHGLCVLDGALDPELLRRGPAEAEALLDDYLTRAAAGRGGIGVGVEQGFVEVMQHAPGRYDMQWDARHAVFSDLRLSTQAIWRNLVQILLGIEYYTLFRGVLMTLPHAAEHPWHADGEHLFPGDGPALPAHCLNVMVPMVDLRADNGPTEYCPGSHLLSRTLTRTYQQDPDLPRRVGFHGRTVAPHLDRGSVVLFDYRIVHRGQPSHSAVARPVLYLTYGRPWFQDVRTFSTRRLGLPEPR